MPASTRARPHPGTQTVARSKQSSLTSLWNQSKPDDGAGLLSPAATPTKRKNVQTVDDSPSVKRARVTPDTSASVKALPTPDSTPTKQRPTSGPRSIPAAGSVPSRIRNGRALLTEFKRLETPASDAPKTPEQNKKSVKARSAALLDRLAEKQKAAEAQPLPPTPRESARRAALQRVPDVVRVLSLPRALGQSSTRRSYSAVGLAQLVKQSARCVLGQGEVLEVLKLLEEDEAALDCRGFVRFVRLGHGEAIVVDSAKKPCADSFEENLRRLS